VDLQRHFWKLVLGAAVFAGAAYELWTPLGDEGVASAGLNALAVAALLVVIHWSSSRATAAVVSIGVISSEGNGTIFRIELPLARDIRIPIPSEVAA
jgi:hypothetical protein